MSLPGSNKKCNFSSPGNTQISIVLFTAQGKKQNINATPECGQGSPLNRLFAAITDSPKTPPRKSNSFNNPFEALMQEEEELDEETEATETTDSNSNISPITNQAQDKPPLLSKKSQTAMKNLKRVQKYLQDTSIIVEIEEVLGKGSYNLLKNIANKTTSNTNQENKKAEEAPQDMEKEDEGSNDGKAKSPNRTVQGMSKVGPAKQVTFAQNTPQKDQTTTHYQASAQHMSPPPPFRW